LKKYLIIALLLYTVILFSIEPQTFEIHDRSSFRILLTPTTLLPENTYFSSTDILGLTWGKKISNNMSYALFAVPPFALSVGFKYQLYSKNNLHLATGGALWISYEEIDLGEMNGSMFIYSQQIITTYGNRNNAFNLSVGINPYLEDGEKSYLPFNCNIGGFFRIGKHTKIIGETSIIEILKSKDEFRVHDIFIGGFRFFWKRSTLDITVGKYDSEISWEDNIIVPIITYTKHF
jgi:hypothetical protein